MRYKRPPAVARILKSIQNERTDRQTSKLVISYRSWHFFGTVADVRVASNVTLGLYKLGVRVPKRNAQKQTDLYLGP